MTGFAVGKNVTRVDALEKVTGKAMFNPDVALHIPNLRYGKILYSPHAHAEIVSVDTSAAKELPGVELVLAGKELTAPRIGKNIADQHILAQDKVRFPGDAVALVAAKTPEIAQQALNLIKVEYKELPALFDIEEAMEPDCPVIIHPELPNYKRKVYAQLGNDLPGPNVHTHHKIRKGNVDEAFKEADLIVENKYSTCRLSHCTLEPFSAIAKAEKDGGLTIWTSAHQTSSVTRYDISDALNLPPSKIKVLFNYIGGSFGALPQIERLAALMAVNMDNPVMIALEREECFLRGPHRVPYTIFIKDGVKKDGTLVAREIKAIVGTGGYAVRSPVLIRNSAFVMSMYRVPTLKWDAYGVYTNDPLTSPFRGFGSTQVAWAIEQQMDIIAEKLQLDAAAVRQKNIIKEGEENLRGEITHSIGASECLDKVATWINAAPPDEKTPEHIKVGRGLALANKYSMIETDSGAAVKVHKDGEVELRVGAEETGQGTQTCLLQIAAEELQIQVEKIRLIWGDTSIVPYDYGNVSSRTTFFVGNAVLLACQDAKRQLFERAAAKLGAAADELETSDGKVYVQGSPQKALSFQEILAELAESEELLGRGAFMFEKGAGQEDPETGLGDRLTASYCYMAQAAEVAVDTETGAVEVLKFCSACDVGEPVNPMMCEGQMDGGAGKGIGSALYEEVILDQGKVINPNFHDYKFPTMIEIPSGENYKTMIVKSPHNKGPFGAKGIGEGAMTPSAPAIANAIYNATGVRIKELPITQEKILQGLKEKKYRFEI